MVASAARIQANRCNAQMSTGPRTSSGKQKSRANAVKHGLCATVVGIEDPEAVAERVEALSETFHFEAWLLKQVATVGLRVEHAQEMQEAARDRLALHASINWEDGRRLEATILGGQIGHRPAQVLEQLLQTPQGCEWLISRWAMLAYAADRGDWTPEQNALALDLQGTPLEFRQGVEPGTEIETGGRMKGSRLEPAALARSQVEELQRRVEVVVKLDVVDRQNAEAGLTDDAELRRLRRYEMALQRQFRWAFELLQEASAQPPAAPSKPQAQPLEPPAPTPEKTTIDRPRPPRRSTTRAEKKRIKAETHREARERKLDKIRS
jgi:hypothetical protein